MLNFTLNNTQNIAYIPLCCVVWPSNTKKV